MEDEKFIEDIMCQKFSIGTYFNSTKYILVYALLANGKINSKYSTNEIASFIFNAYCDNLQLAKRHPNVEVQNVPKFGIDVIYRELELSLYEWLKDAPNGIIKYDMKNILIEKSFEFSAEKICKVMKILFVKTFGCNFILPESLDQIREINDEDVELFGNSLFKVRAMREYQHCLLCDCANYNELRAVRILRQKHGLLDTEKSDVNNIIIMCKEHAAEFLLGKFKFSDNGKVKNLSSTTVSEQMRIDINYRTPERMKYVKRANN